MTAHRRNRFLAALAVAHVLAPSARGEEDDCKYLLQNAERLFQEGQFDVLFWDDSLSPLSSFHAPEYTCPWRTPDEDQIYCDPPHEANLTEPLVAPPFVDDDWNGVDFGEIVMDAVLNRENFAVCRDIFEGDERLRAALAKLPRLTDAQRARFEALAARSKEYGSAIDARRAPSAGENAPQFSETQEKILGAFDALGEWRYCAKDKFVAPVSGGRGQVLAQYHQSTPRRVTLYNGACAARDLWGLDISFVPSFFSAYLIAAHEFGHALHDLSGGEPLKQAQSEAMATYYGSLFGECAARRADEFFDRLDRDISTDMGFEVLPYGTLDREYAECAVSHLRNWDEFFRKARAEIDLSTGEIPQTLRAVNEVIRPIEAASQPRTNAPAPAAPRELNDAPQSRGAMPPWRDDPPAPAVLRAFEGDAVLPIFDLIDLKGRHRRTDDFRGHVVVLKFWAPWCKPCRDEIASTERAFNALERHGVIVAAIIEGDQAAAARFLAPLEISFPVLLDPGANIIQELGVRSMPYTIVADRTGKVRYSLTGGAIWDAPELLAKIGELAANRPK